MRSIRPSIFYLATFFVTAAATAATIDLSESRRVVGRENDIRVDAVLREEQFGPRSTVAISFQISNLGRRPIAVAGLSPRAEYDQDTRTITVTIGSEIPDPRRFNQIVRIGGGEEKVFVKGARMNVFPDLSGPTVPTPLYVRVKVNYLDDPETLDARSGSGELSRLLAAWVERNQTVFTNTLPIRWGNTSRDGADASE